VIIFFIKSGASHFRFLLKEGLLKEVLLISIGIK